ncbi:hypothetical protein LY78DRAFT_703473 [Colletotrichum sublineola]|nr:hypothetical protein LY78DRAFT_703473 [Colletotrichum sublineola]
MPPMNFWASNGVRTLWGLEPRWSVDPDQTAIMETVKSTLNIPGACSIELLGGGAFNKLYIVRYAEKEVVARVTLPVEPKWKALSEVATMQWVRQNTGLPVPEVLGFNADRGNPIGFEWIIMSKVPGRPWADAWREIPFSAKEELVRQIASFCSETFAHRFYGIGNLFPGTTPDPGPHLPEPERIVSSAFIGVDVDPKIPRGPFPTSREWPSVRLDLAESDCRRRLNRVLESDPADGSNVQLLPPPGGPEFEPSVIYHDDMSRHNILVDDEGALTAVVDWECVSALPLYIACQYPPFLQGRPRDVEPIKSMYQHDEEGNVVELYWEHLEDYELTQLRRLFLEEMGKLQPEWVSIFNKSQRQRDYDLAVTSCDDTFMIRRILTWLSDLESRSAEVKGLEERLDDGTL